MALERLSGFAITSSTTGFDLEKVLGPLFARGLLRQGQSAFAILGVNAQETQASIDASLTFGILWLDACRQAQAGKVLGKGSSCSCPSSFSGLIFPASLIGYVIGASVVSWWGRRSRWFCVEVSMRGLR